MSDIRFAVIGDCHYSTAGNYGARDCLGAKTVFESVGTTKISSLELAEKFI